MVGPGPASGRDLIEAAPQLLSTGGHTKLLAAVADSLSVRRLAPLQVVLGHNVWVFCHAFPFTDQISTGSAPRPLRIMMSTANELNDACATKHGSKLSVLW
jgi:hypothetical protein